MSMIQDIDFTAPWRQKAKIILLYLRDFLVKPIDTIRRIPEWDWFMVLGFIGAMAAVSGLVGGAIHASFAQMIAGVFLLPISTTFFCGALAGIVYYYAHFVLKQELSFKKLFLAMGVCAIPSLILHPATFVIPPLVLLSTFLSSCLIIVSLQSNFQITRQVALRAVMAFYGVFVVVWLTNSLLKTQRGEELTNMTTPESIDILEKEMKGMSDK